MLRVTDSNSNVSNSPPNDLTDPVLQKGNGIKGDNVASAFIIPNKEDENIETIATANRTADFDTAATAALPHKRVATRFLPCL
jgi:hypothetical protein